LAALFLSCTGAQIVGDVGFAAATDFLGVPIVASYVVASVVAVAYGVALIVTARAPQTRLVPWLMAGLVGNRAARVWYGLVYVIPPLIAWGVSFGLRPTATTQYRSAFWLAAPLTALGCILCARSSSNLDAKRAVMTGAAPSYELSADGTWWRNGDAWASVIDRVWWNGSGWVETTAEVPADALKSPDGNYWWTGTSWCAMPPIPKRRQRAPRVSAASF
jgi:hypothetical protein